MKKVNHKTRHKKCFCTNSFYIRLTLYRDISVNLGNLEIWMQSKFYQINKKYVPARKFKHKSLGVKSIFVKLRQQNYDLVKHLSLEILEKKFGKYFYNKSTTATVFSS